MWIETHTTFPVTVLENVNLEHQERIDNNIKVEHRLGGLEVHGNGSVTVCRLLALPLLNFHVILPKCEFLMSCVVRTHSNLIVQGDQQSYCTV